MVGKTTDGFFWPNEFGKPQLPKNRTRFQSYRLPQGLLFLKTGTFKSYGYANEADFIADCRGGKLHARTLKGALSLGAARYCPEGQDCEVHVYPADCVGRLTYYANGASEAEQMTSVLRRHFKTAKIVSSQGRMSSLFAAAPTMAAVRSGLSVFKTDAKWILLYQLCLGIAVALLLAAGWHKPSPVTFGAAIAVAGLSVAIFPKVFRLISANSAPQKPAKATKPT